MLLPIAGLTSQHDNHQRNGAISTNRRSSFVPAVYYIYRSCPPCYMLQSLELQRL